MQVRNPSPKMWEDYFCKKSQKKPNQIRKTAWKHLRRKELEGLKFRRQAYWKVHFVCFEKRLIIEVDGGHHASQTKKDMERDKWFDRQNFKVLRFWNNEVLTNINGIGGN